MTDSEKEEDKTGELIKNNVTLHDLINIAKKKERVLVN